MSEKKQWAAGYNDPPGPPSEDELDIFEREARAEFGPGWQVASRHVLEPVEAWGPDGELLDHKVGLVVWLFEENEFDPREATPEELAEKARMADEGGIE